MRRYALFVGLTLSCAGAAEQQPKANETVPAIEMLTYEGRIVSERLDRITLELPLQVTSPLEGTLRLGAVQYTLEVTGEPTVQGAVALTDVIEGPGKLESAFQVAARLPVNDEAFARRTTALLAYTVDAQIEVSTADGLELFDAQWTGEIFAPKRPTLTVMPQAARYAGAIDLTVLTTLSNPNGFPLRVRSVPYSLAIAGEQVVERELTRLVTLPARSETQFDFQHRIDRDTHPELLKLLKKTNGFEYDASATLELEALQITLTDQGSAVFPR